MVVFVRHLAAYNVSYIIKLVAAKLWLCVADR